MHFIFPHSFMLTFSSGVFFYHGLEEKTRSNVQFNIRSLRNMKQSFIVNLENFTRDKALWDNLG